VKDLEAREEIALAAAEAAAKEKMAGKLKTDKAKPYTRRGKRRWSRYSG
jgi:hypothetical protein